MNNICSVCCNNPISDRPCICGGVGTATAEAQGLRELVFDLEQKLEDTNRYIDHLTEKYLIEKARIV